MFKVNSSLEGHPLLKLFDKSYYQIDYSTVFDIETSFVYIIIKHFPPKGLPKDHVITSMEESSLNTQLKYYSNYKDRNILLLIILEDSISPCEHNLSIWNILAAKNEIMLWISFGLNDAYYVIQGCLSVKLKLLPDKEYSTKKHEELSKDVELDEHFIEKQNSNTDKGLKHLCKKLSNFIPAVTYQESVRLCKHIINNCREKNLDSADKIHDNDLEIKNRKKTIRDIFIGMKDSHNLQNMSGIGKRQIENITGFFQVNLNNEQSK